MSKNPGRAARTLRRIEHSTQQALHRRLGSFVRARKGTRAYYAIRHRRRGKR